MENTPLVDLIREKGLLIEKGIYDALNMMSDEDIAKIFLESLEKVAGQKMITSGVLIKNIATARQVVSTLGGETKQEVEKIFIKLGLQMEIVPMPKSDPDLKSTELETTQTYRILIPGTIPGRKIAVSDFLGHFRSRYQQLQRILMQHQGLVNLTSINKLSGNRQSITIIGMVTNKRITKNRNLIISFQDLTGEISALVKTDSGAFSVACELQLDDVVAVKASGNNDLLFIQDIVFPDAVKLQRSEFDSNACVAFVSDIHAGSVKHLGKEFERFIEWMNGGSEDAKNIKYIFFVGDNVDGVGVFPGQEKLLDITSLKEQYELLASYISKIPPHVTMFMCPGQHDSVRVPEPQPIIDPIYGEALYGIENLRS